MCLAASESIARISWAKNVQQKRDRPKTPKGIWVLREHPCSTGMLNDSVFFSLFAILDVVLRTVVEVF